MKVFLSLLISILFLQPVFSQRGNTVQAKDSTSQLPLIFVEQMPEFPGGEKKLIEYIAKHTIYPRKARKQGDQGTVMVRFVVGKDGRVSEANIIRGVSPELDQEALRVVNRLPLFKPGYQDGQPASVYFTVPFRFTLR